VSVTVFRRLLTQFGKLKDTAGNHRSTYSLSDTCATLGLVAGTNVDTMARPMGTRVVMLERHDSKLPAALAMEKLAQGNGLLLH